MLRMLSKFLTEGVFVVGLSVSKIISSIIAFGLIDWILKLLNLIPVSPGLFPCFFFSF